MGIPMTEKAFSISQDENGVHIKSASDLMAGVEMLAGRVVRQLGRQIQQANGLKTVSYGLGKADITVHDNNVWNSLDAVIGKYTYQKEPNIG